LRLARRVCRPMVDSEGDFVVVELSYLDCNVLDGVIVLLHR
jgi:hypothetical protein